MHPCSLPKQDSMLLWVSLLTLAALCEHFATAHQSVISIRPPWTTFFQGKTVKMICNGSHDYVAGQTQYYWHFQKNTLSVTTENNLKVRKSGTYRCQAPGSLPSNPVNVLFYSGPLILQTPSSMFEGDRLVLKCKKRGRGRREELTAMKYTRNGEVLHRISNFNNSLELVIPQARLNDSGAYQCFGTVNKMYTYKSNLKIIKIQELFPHPTLTITDPQPEEGSSVTLVCQVQLPPERQDTLLHFIFYRDNGVVLSKWSRSPEFQIPNIWRKDSGAYWCGAETVLNSIYKHSPPREIHVQRKNGSTARRIANSRSTAIAVGVTWGLFTFLLLTLALLFYCWHQRKSGAGIPEDTGDTASSSPTPRPKESPQPMCPDAMELQPVDGYAHLKEGNMVYSEIQTICVKEEGNVSFTTSPENTQTAVIYSEVKNSQLPEESSEKISSKDENPTESS